MLLTHKNIYVIHKPHQYTLLQTTHINTHKNISLINAKSVLMSMCMLFVLIEYQCIDWVDHFDVCMCSCMKVCMMMNMFYISVC